MKTLSVIVGLLMWSCALFGQQPRVFVSDSQSWETKAGVGGSNGSFGGAGSGGARPQTAEIIKTFGERCKDVLINNKRETADYVVILEHEGGKSLILKDNKVVVFNTTGDSILSRSTRTLGSAVQEACTAITKDWAAHGSKRADPPAAATGTAPEMTGGKVAVSSTPAGADIEVDGAFVGSTPSAITLMAGEHSVVVKKNGFKAWERRIKITGGEITLMAELEKVD